MVFFCVILRFQTNACGVSFLLDGICSDDRPSGAWEGHCSTVLLCKTKPLPIPPWVGCLYAHGMVFIQHVTVM